MTERVVEIAEGPARLHVRHRQLVIEREGKEAVTTPLEEVVALVLAHPQVEITHTVLAGLAAEGGMVVVSDEKHQPAGMLLPLVAHFAQTERLAKQAQMGEPRRKRLWQQVVRAKLRAQGRLLEQLQGLDGGVAAMARRVRSGDPENVEAQGARVYWGCLFGDAKFRRGSEGPDQNRHLNYGYAVLRATVARAVCTAGLHPSLGLKHHNRYDPFSLASDVMEPFRPLVDRAVALWVRQHDPAAPLDPQAKAWLVAPVMGRYRWAGEERTLFDLLARMTSSLARVIAGEQKCWELPEPEAIEEEGG